MALWEVLPPLSWAGLAGGLAILGVLGTVASWKAVEETGLSDPSCVVIDEWFGQGVTLLVAPHTLLGGGLAFVFFRFDGIGRYIPGDKSFYVKVLVRKTRQVAIIPFVDFINDFTRQINTQPVVSWAVKRP